MRNFINFYKGLNTSKNMISKFINHTIYNLIWVWYQDLLHQVLMGLVVYKMDLQVKKN